MSFVPQISILIVNWNTRDFLRACLISLRENAGDLAPEILVVDNDSRDGSAETVAREFPEVTLIRSTENLGFAGGNNLAFEKSRGELIWLLNPDTEILPRAAQELVEFLARKPEIGAVASALVDARSGEIQRSCRTFPTPAALWVQALGLARVFGHSKRFGFYKMGWWNYADARRVEQPMASSLMIRRAAIEKIGGLFDPRFPIFFNDVDLSWRLEKAGFETWFVPASRVKHWGGAATAQLGPEMIGQSHRSLRAFYEKNYRGEISAFIFWPTVWMSELAGKARELRAKTKRRA